MSLLCVRFLPWRVCILKEWREIYMRWLGDGGGGSSYDGDGRCGGGG